MFDKISMCFFKKTLYKNENIDKEKEEVLLYSINKIIGEISKLIIIVIISFILHIINEFVIVLIITLLYKTFIGGAHAKTDIECLIFSVLYYIAPALLAKYIIVPNIYIYIAMFLVFVESLYVILKIAPADTEEVPILSQKNRKTMKNKALIVLFFIYFIALIFFRNNMYILKLVVITLFSINFYTTKIAYRFFGCKYSYESEEINKIIDSYKKERGG